MLELDGERIVKATPDIGYLHSGLREAGRASRLQPVRDDRRPEELHQPADERGGLAPCGREAAGHRADAAVPVHPGIICELARISDHLLCTGAAALDLGAFTAFLYAFNLRELIYDVYEEMSGYRFHPGYTRVGGVLYDFNDRVLEPHPGGAGELPQGLRRHGEAAVPQPDLPGPGAGHRRAEQGRRDRVLLLRADRPRQRRHLRHPQGRAVPRLSRARFRGPLRDGGGLLGAVHRPDGGDAAEPPAPPAGRREAARAGRSTCRSPRSTRCPTS